MTVADLAATALPAFVASLVECVEALTVVLAVGFAAGWRAALGGALAALLVLVGAVVAFGPLLATIPERPVKLVVGALLLVFGLRWLRKAILRAGGALALRDEGRAFERTRAAVASGTGGRPGNAWNATLASFGGVAFEGLEVVFIVLALGRSGAGAAVVLVFGLGLALHRPLMHVPENALKLFVGVVLSALGSLWLLQGAGAAFATSDAALLVVVAVYALLASAVVAIVRRRVGPAARP